MRMFGEYKFYKSYVEKKVMKKSFLWSLWIHIQRQYSQQLIFFVTLKWTQRARVFNYISLERLTRDKHSSLFHQFISYNENKV